MLEKREGIRTLSRVNKYSKIKIPHHLNSKKCSKNIFLEIACILYNKSLLLYWEYAIVKLEQVQKISV